MSIVKKNWFQEVKDPLLILSKEIEREKFKANLTLRRPECWAGQN